MSKKIYIDAGHGGVQPGACNGKRRESDDVLRMALKVQEYLKGQDCEVRMSRTTDIDVDIDARCADANKWGADYFLSIHRNSASASATGNEIWVYSKATSTTEAKAKVILDNVCKADGLKKRGVYKGAVSYSDYGVNKYTNMHSALIELGFISNSSDNKVYDEKLDAVALALAKSLLSVVGGSWKSVSTSTTKPTASTTTSPTATPEKSSIVAGAKLTLSNVALYASSSAKSKSSTKSGTFYVWSKDVVNNRIRITNSTANVGKSGQVTGWIAVSDAEKSMSSKTNETAPSSSFQVKVIDDSLNIRSGAGTQYDIVGKIKDHGVYTITETKGTVGKAGSWGKLKSKAGWISLNSCYVKKL